jgi:hypothetical protein
MESRLRAPDGIKHLDALPTKLNARAATWRDETGRTVATVYGATECRKPRNPRDLAARTEDGGYETIMRCRDCDGCRKYEELVLRRELAETYKGVTDELWILFVEADPGEHSRLGARIRRGSAGAWEPCLYRLGPQMFALVAKGERPALQRLRALRARTWRLVPVGRGRKPRDFRALTRGLMVEREHYGAWANRFYHRDRARLPRETFIVERQGGIRKRHPDAKGGVRAWRRGLSLYPSLVTQGSELMALLLRRDGDLNGRKCTHEKCPPERCHYAHRAPAATLPVKSGARVSAPSSSLNDRISELPPAHGVQREVATGATRPMKHSGGVPPNPKTYINSVNGGRAAGSLTPGNAFSEAWLARMRKIAAARGPDTK